jgi:hypothetical protein
MPVPGIETVLRRRPFALTEYRSPGIPIDAPRPDFERFRRTPPPMLMLFRYRIPTAAL